MKPSKIQSANTDDEVKAEYFRCDRQEGNPNENIVIEVDEEDEEPISSKEEKCSKTVHVVEYDEEVDYGVHVTTYEYEDFGINDSKSDNVDESKIVHCESVETICSISDVNTKKFEVLARKLQETEDGILKHYIEFRGTHPNGCMTEKEFVENCLQTEYCSEDKARSLFNVFTVGEIDGTIDFMEFMMARKAIGFRSIEDKLSWMFNVYDHDAGGRIDPMDVREIVLGLFTLAGIDQVDDGIVYGRSKELLSIINIDGNGEITKEEFLAKAMACDFICDIFKLCSMDDS